MAEEMNNGGMEETRGGSKLKWVVLLIIVIIGLAGWYYYSNGMSFTKVDQAKKNEAEVASIVEKIGKRMVLPTGEEPAVFDITDPQTLIAQQAFFTNAVKGDKLLVYPKAAKAIIYSPSRDVIVNVGPLTFDQQAAQAQTTQTKPATKPATATTTKK